MQDLAQADPVTGTPLKLTVSEWWRELDRLIKDGTIPTELGMCLKSLVGAHFTKSIPPAASHHLVELAKIHLGGGIELSDSALDKLYDVMVFVPDDKEINRSFFLLVPKYPGGQLTYLQDV